MLEWHALLSSQRCESSWRWWRRRWWVQLFIDRRARAYRGIYEHTRALYTSLSLSLRARHISFPYIYTTTIVPAPPRPFFTREQESCILPADFPLSHSLRFSLSLSAGREVSPRSLFLSFTRLTFVFLLPFSISLSPPLLGLFASSILLSGKSFISARARASFMCAAAAVLFCWWLISFLWGVIRKRVSWESVTVEENLLLV